MNPKTECFHLDRFEVLGRGVLQPFDITWREGDFDAVVSLTITRLRPAS